MKFKYIIILPLLAVHTQVAAINGRCSGTTPDIQNGICISTSDCAGYGGTSIQGSPGAWYSQIAPSCYYAIFQKYADPKLGPVPTTRTMFNAVISRRIAQIVTEIPDAHGATDVQVHGRGLCLGVSFLVSFFCNEMIIIILFGY
jgi:hypothetical protein